MTDTLQKFMFENAAVRGELVELSDTWRQVQQRHDYPKAVRTLLGEMLAAAALSKRSPSVSLPRQLATNSASGFPAFPT